MSGEIATTAELTVPKRTKASAYQRRRYEPKTFDLRGELYRIFGVDLTNVPGISAITAQTILCEIGTDVLSFAKRSNTPSISNFTTSSIWYVPIGFLP
jgi:hypothetical protein